MKIYSIYPCENCHMLLIHFFIIRSACHLARFLPYWGGASRRSKPFAPPAWARTRWASCCPCRVALTSCGFHGLPEDPGGVAKLDRRMEGFCERENSENPIVRNGWWLGVTPISGNLCMHVYIYICHYVIYIYIFVYISWIWVGYYTVQVGYYNLYKTLVLLGFNKNYNATTSMLIKLHTNGINFTYTHYIRVNDSDCDLTLDYGLVGVSRFIVSKSDWLVVLCYSCF